MASNLIVLNKFTLVLLGSHNSLKQHAVSQFIYAGDRVVDPSRDRSELLEVGTFFNCQLLTWSIVSQFVPTVLYKKIMVKDQEYQLKIVDAAVHRTFIAVAKADAVCFFYR